MKKNAGVTCYYHVGQHTLRQTRMNSIPMHILQMLEFNKMPPATDQQAFAKFWNDLDTSGKLRDALLEILEFETKPESAPEKAMSLAQVWEMAPPTVRAEMVRDFIVLNFGPERISTLAKLG